MIASRPREQINVYQQVGSMNSKNTDGVAIVDYSFSARREASQNRNVLLSLAIGLAGLLAIGCDPSPPVVDSAGQENEIEFAVSESSLAGTSINPVAFRSKKPLASKDAFHNSRYQWRLKRLEDAMHRPKLSEFRHDTHGTRDAQSEIVLVSQPAEPKLEVQPTDVSSEPVQLVADTAESTDLPRELAPDAYKDWPVPEVAIFVTGQQNGYIEPCGCTGLEKQKGGIARRMTFMKQLRGSGWDLVPIDVGNQIRRIGQQAAIKLSWSHAALRAMKYESIGLGPSDLRLAATDLLAVVVDDDPSLYASANVALIDPEFIPSYKVISRGAFKIGVTNVLDPKAMDGPLPADVTIESPTETAKKALQDMNNDGATFRILTYFGKEKDAIQAVKSVPGYDLVVVGGGYGEPTYKPQPVEGSNTKMIVPGNKGMYAGLIGFYQGKPYRYARVPLTHEFSDDSEMRKLMGDYQDHLKSVGLEKLGLRPSPHPSGQKYVGSAACKDCHKEAYSVWEFSPHVDATDSIVSPPEDRGDVPRHFDPECLSCHVTGWNPQDYYPYESGFMDLEAGKHLHGNGCENCHGPGSAHVAAEAKGSGATDAQKATLRKSMDLPMSKAKDHCMECHDLDNSPAFHDEGAFENDYWPQIEH